MFLLLVSRGASVARERQREREREGKSQYGVEPTTRWPNRIKRSGAATTANDDHDDDDHHDDEDDDETPGLLKPITYGLSFLSGREVAGVRGSRKTNANENPPTWRSWTKRETK